MNIQSLSVVVPNGGRCWNRCPFCVSRMHHEEYGKSIIGSHNFDCQLPTSYMNRIRFVRDEGCNAMMITGDCEPQQNMRFVLDLLFCNKCLPNPFYNITLQTTGSGLNEEDIKKMASLGLTTVSFSISSFNAERNADIIGMPDMVRNSYYDLNTIAKSHNLVTRASINLTDEFAKWSPEYYFAWAKLNDFDQITFRKIYASGDNEQSRWITEHAFPDEMLEQIDHYIRKNGTPIMRLPYGLMKYSVDGISTVLDDDCMSKENTDDLKYAILRPNGHLYSRWDDPGSLIF